MKKGLFALALGTFTLGMAEFIIEGIITDVYRAQNEAYKIEKTKKWEKSMNDRELER